MSRVIVWQLQIDWDLDGVYTDESSRLIRANGQMRLANPADSLTAGRGIVDRAQLTLDNRDNRYSSLITTSPLYSAISGGGAYHAPVRLNVSIDGGSTFNRWFTGVIKLPDESTATSKAAGTIDLDCRSRDESILNARQSSSRTEFAQIQDEGWTEEEIIAQWLENAGLVDGTDFVSQAYAAAHPGSTATLDPGFWHISWAWLDDESPLEEMWALAAACGGRVYCDPEGLYRYENAAHWLLGDHTTVQASLDKGDFVDLKAIYDDRELFSGVTVEASPRALLDSDTVWETDGSIFVGAGQTKTITARLRQPIYSLAGATYTAITSGGTDISSDVSVTLTEYAQRVEIEIQNNHATQAAILAELYLTGQAVDGGPTVEETADSSAAFWTNRHKRRRPIRGNAYLQSSAQAAFVAEFLRDRYQSPRLFFGAKNTPGDPARRLGDRVSVDDGDLMSAARKGFVTGIHWRLGKSGFRQDLTLIDAASLYPYETDPAYFVLGSNRLGTDAVSTDPGRLFY